MHVRQRFRGSGSVQVFDSYNQILYSEDDNKKQNSTALRPNLTASIGSKTTGSSSDLTTVHCTGGNTANKK